MTTADVDEEEEEEEEEDDDENDDEVPVRPDLVGLGMSSLVKLIFLQSLLKLMDTYSYLLTSSGKVDFGWWLTGKR